MTLFGIAISPVHYIAVPLFAAFLIPIAGKVWKEFARIIPGLVFLYLVGISITMYPAALESPIVEMLAGWQPPLGINLYYGPLGGFLASIFSVLGLIVWIYSFQYMKEEPIERFYMLFMLLVAGATGIVLTGDIFNLFVFLEITAISAYSLTAFLRKRHGAEAAFKYILMGSLASTFILIGILILYAFTGTLNMADLAVRMENVPYAAKILVLILFLVGFGIEAEIFPLNGWAPDAYSEAPTPIGAIFGGIVVKAGIYALVRILFTVFALSSTFYFIALMGIITLLVAEMAAIRQGQIKRMLAYSSIGQMGLVLIAFGVGSGDAMYGALFAMFNHAVIKPMLFFAAGYLLFYSVTDNLDDLNGLGKKRPWSAFIFSIGALAIIGLPPFSGFWGKFYILTALANKGQMLLVFLVLVGGVIEAVYYLRVIGRLYLQPAADIETQKTPVGGMLAMALLAIVVIAIGIYPDLLEGFLKPAAQELMDKAVYIKETLTMK